MKTRRALRLASSSFPSLYKISPFLLLPSLYLSFENETSIPLSENFPSFPNQKTNQNEPSLSVHPSPSFLRASTFFSPHPHQLAQTFPPLSLLLFLLPSLSYRCLPPRPLSLLRLSLRFPTLLPRSLPLPPSLQNPPSSFPPPSTINPSPFTQDPLPPSSESLLPQVTSTLPLPDEESLPPTRTKDRSRESSRSGRMERRTWSSSSLMELVSRE